MFAAHYGDVHRYALRRGRATPRGGGRQRGVPRRVAAARDRARGAVAVAVRRGRPRPVQPPPRCTAPRAPGRSGRRGATRSRPRPRRAPGRARCRPAGLRGPRRTRPRGAAPLRGLGTPGRSPTGARRRRRVPPRVRDARPAAPASASPRTCANRTPTTTSPPPTSRRRRRRAAPRPTSRRRRAAPRRPSAVAAPRRCRSRRRPARRPRVSPPRHDGLPGALRCLIPSPACARPTPPPTSTTPAPPDDVLRAILATQPARKRRRAPRLVLAGATLAIAAVVGIAALPASEKGVRRSPSARSPRPRPCPTSSPTPRPPPSSPASRAWRPATRCASGSTATGCTTS